MKTLTSENLLDQPPRLEITDRIDFGARQLPIDSQFVIELSDQHTDQIAQDILRGLTAFGAQEPTRSMNTIGLPTAVARVDCTVDPRTGAIHTYEVEERPAGMGVSDALVSDVTGYSLGKGIVNHLEETFGSAPVVKRHPNALENDDSLLFDVETLSPTRLSAKGRPVLVRAEPKDMAAHPQLAEATHLSITPILEKGKREYRITTGAAHIITDAAVLPEDSFVLKTLQGSKAKGVSIFLTKADAKALGSNRDCVTRARAEQLVQSEGAVLVERFVPGIPIEAGAGVMGRMILRVFALVSDKSVQVIGGAYMARPGHMVHGSKDAVSGAIITEEGMKLV